MKTIELNQRFFIIRIFNLELESEIKKCRELKEQ